MENTIHSLIDLYKLSTFSIPAYQRAYSWDCDPQLHTFIADLRDQAKTTKDDNKNNNKKTYFLGTLLLHEINKSQIHIVDGQQRMTTAVIFIAAALNRYRENSSIFSGKYFKEKELRNYFIFNEVEEVQKFKTISEDNPFFRSYILKIVETTVSEESPSSCKLKQAFDFFTKEVLDEEWDELLNVLISAKVMIYSVQNPADATLIFELQNDRGKQLTDLESLKSYLMHLVYLHSSKNPDEGLAEIQTQFSKIYRNIEHQMSYKKVPSEDAILAYHCAAYLKWKEDEWRNPKKLVKNTIKNLDRNSVITWVLKFVSELHETYKSITDIFSSLEDMHALSELIILDKMASFWPLILKTYKLDLNLKKENFHLSCRLMEVYAMRGYGISNIRSDAGLSSLYNKAKEFCGNFQDLHSFLHSMSFWYDIPNRFETGLDRASFYKSNRKDAQYLLWRYENYLRSQQGKKTERLTLKQYISPLDDGSRLSIEHIAAVQNPISDEIVEWEKGNQQKFSDVATHRLGNLVIDSKSANSSKGKYDFTDKLDSLSNQSTFLSQGELISMAIKDINGIYVWSIDSIKKRHEKIKSWALKMWDPSTHYLPSKSIDFVAEEELENLNDQ